MRSFVPIGFFMVVLAACSTDPSATTSGAAASGPTGAGGAGTGGDATTTTSATTGNGAGGGGGGAGGAGTGGAGPAVETRGMWVWQKAVVTNPTEEAKLFTFCADRGVNTVFVESQDLIGSSQPELAAFIDDASKKGILVELLYGNMDWALPAGHAEAIALAKASVKFAAGLGAGAKPVGVHFDVEPYTLDEWTSDQEGTANAYLDLLEALAGETSGSGLRLSADIAFWFDTVMVTRKGQARPLSEWVIDSIDRAVLMDYRDTSDEIIKQADEEIPYAAGKGRAVLIGLETLCNLKPTYITFCEEGVGALNQALDATHAQYEPSGGFAGFGIHDYVAYQALKP